MTDQEKIAKYDEIAGALWNMAINGNLLHSALCAAIIRQLEIPSPDGADPEDA